MSSFFAELQRRNVYRVGAAYLVVSWILAQLSEIAVPALLLPEWVNSLVFLLLGLGFPIALIFAWAFDLAPEGIRLTTEEDLEKPDTKRGRGLELVVFGVMLILVGYTVFGELTGDGAGTVAQKAAKSGFTSIAVLPFVDMSAEGDQEFFTDGISEEILNLLAQMPGLKVTSRSSAFSYKGRSFTIKEVGQELNVAHVLEGSVRKSGNQIRITAQLIEADTDQHLWSETYDRTLDNVFAVQDDVSAAIVDAVGAALDVAPRLEVGARQDIDPRAREAFLLAQTLISERRIESFGRAIESLNDALLIEPNYTEAIAQLALAELLRVDYSRLDSAATIAEYLPRVEAAAASAPNNPSVIGVLGFYQQATLDIPAALVSFERALSINPSLTDVRIWYANALRDSGDALEARKQYEMAYLNDPLSIQAMRNFLQVKLDFRELEELEPVLERLERIAPEHGATYRAGVLAAQMRLADALNGLLDALSARPDSIALRQTVLAHMLNLGIPLADLVHLWPLDPPGVFKYQEEDVEQRLILMAEVRAQRELDPNEKVQFLLALMEAGRFEVARPFIETGYAEGAANLKSDSYGSLMAWLAYAEGDLVSARSYAQVPYARLFNDYQAGRRTSDILYELSIFEFLMNPESPRTALRYYAESLELGLINPAARTFGFRALGWDEIPGFVQVHKSSEERIETERDLVLTRLCQEGAQAFWQPALEKCAALGSGAAATTPGS